MQAGQELVQDGGFEAGDFCYWNLAGDATVYENNGVDYSDDPNGTGYAAHAGENFAVLGQVTDLSYLSQRLPTRAGQFYRLSLWLEDPTNAAPNQFQVQWNTNAAAMNIIFNQLNMGSFGWSNFVFVVKATTNVTTLQFGSRNDNTYFALDSVSVVPAPAPSLQVLTTGKTALQLVWTALAGLSYQVQYATNLLQTNWINNGAAVTATTNSVTLPETVGPDTARFYRVELLP